MEFRETFSKRILFSALNWGMGHVSRSISILKKLQHQQNIIFIACDDSQKAVFLSYLKDIIYIKHEGYPFEFDLNKRFEKSIFSQKSSLFKSLKQEKNDVEKWCDEFQIDVVISDHRYGFNAKNTYSIFITHQLNLPLPWYLFFVQTFHKRLVSKFNKVWICDNELENFAGKLSKPWKNLPAAYIGVQSRFELYETIEKNEAFDNLYVISGPVPFANQLLEISLKHAKESKGKHKIVVPSSIKQTQTTTPDNTQLIIANNWHEIDYLFKNCSTIISRSGYSTIMDLTVLKKNAFLIPTPNQYEQEYLINYLEGNEKIKGLKRLRI
jgi:uncharacterized protein (TIGR00661 family)